MLNLNFEEYCEKVGCANDRTIGPNHIFLEHEYGFIEGLCDDGRKNFQISSFVLKSTLKKLNGYGKLMFYYLLRSLAAKDYETVSVPIDEKNFGSMPFWHSINVLTKYPLSLLSDEPIRFSGPVRVDISDRVCARAMILDHSRYRVLACFNEWDLSITSPVCGLQDRHDLRRSLIDALEDELGWDSCSKVAFKIASRPMFCTTQADDSTYRIDGKVYISNDTYFKVVMAPSTELPLPENSIKTIGDQDEESSDMYLQWVNIGRLYGEKIKPARLRSALYRLGMLDEE